MKVAVLDDGDGTVADALATAGNDVVSAKDAAALVAVGEDALLEAVLDGPAKPVLPVAVDAGRYAVSRSALAPAAAALADGEGRAEAHSTLSVSVDGDSVGRALLDVTLMTSEPARISEYGVRIDAEYVAEFRADGVVIATPLGSAGYARAAGGPLLTAETGVCVVPVSPFATRTDTWVAPDDVVASVERDDGDVSLYLDGRETVPLAPHERVTVRPDGEIRVLRVP